MGCGKITTGRTLKNTREVKMSVKKLKKGEKLISRETECDECFYDYEVDLVGNFGFARHKVSLKLLVEVAGGLFMPPDTRAADGTQLRKVGRTGGGYDCYDQNGNTYSLQKGKWVRTGIKYPESPAGPRGRSAKVGARASM